MQEFSFPSPDLLQSRSYCLFDDELERDKLVFFHATSSVNFDSIVEHGLLLPQATRQRPHPAVSFAKESKLSLFWAMNSRKSLPGEYVVFVVRYPSAEGLEDHGEDVHDRRAVSPRTIVGYCRIPADYVYQ